MRVMSASREMPASTCKLDTEPFICSPATQGQETMLMTMLSLDAKQDALGAAAKRVAACTRLKSQFCSVGAC